MSRKYLPYIAIVLTLPLQFGLHMAILNAPMDYMGCKGVEGPTLDCIEGWRPAMPSSMYAFGGLFGSAVTTMVTRYVGLDGSLCVAALFFQLGTLVFRFAHMQWSVVISRLITGIGAGIAIVGSPIAINLLAPPHLRALFGAQTQISANVGIILAQAWGVIWSENHWRRIVSAAVLLAMASLVAVVYLRVVDRHALVAPRTSAGTASTDLADRPESENHQVSVATVLMRPAYRRLLIVSVAIFVVQQLTGINAIIQYGTRILADVFPAYAKQMNLVISLTNLVMTIAGAFFINQFGRKRLLIISLTLMGAFTGMLAFALVRGLQGLTALSAILTIASFAIGIGPIPFLYISEIAPAEAVDAAQSLGTVSSWLATFGVVALFPGLQASWGPSAFYFFSGCTLTSAVLGAYYLQADKQ